MIALDTNALSLLFVPGAQVFRRGSKAPVKHAKERVEALVREMARKKGAILIPTPVLCELLTKVPRDKIASLLDELNRSVWFRIEAFDTASAVELAERTAKAIASGDKREGLKDPPWTKIKFDRQILVIAIVNGASELISNDPDLVALGARWGFRVSDVEDLPVPEELVPPPLFAGLEDNNP